MENPITINRLIHVFVHQEPIHNSEIRIFEIYFVVSSAKNTSIIYEDFSDSSPDFGLEIYSQYVANWKVSRWIIFCEIRWLHFVKNNSVLLFSIYFFSVQFHGQITKYRNGWSVIDKNPRNSSDTYWKLFAAWLFSAAI